MNKEELIKELNFILSLVKKDSRIGKFLQEIKKILDDRI
jgi:hypothetical protein